MQYLAYIFNHSLRFLSLCLHSLPAARTLQSLIVPYSPLYSLTVQHPYSSLNEVYYFWILLYKSNVISIYTFFFSVQDDPTTFMSNTQETYFASHEGNVEHLHSFLQYSDMSKISGLLAVLLQLSRGIYNVVIRNKSTGLNHWN